MDAFNALQFADEVKTFPNIDMPAPSNYIGSTKRGLLDKHKSLFYNNSNSIMKESIILPGLLKSRKTMVHKNGRDTSVLNNLPFTGFNTTNFKLDMETSEPNIHQLSESSENLTIPFLKGVTKVDIVGGDLIVDSNTMATSKSNIPRSSDDTLDELRNYITLMDKYSLHNFMIYQGKALIDTPEFQSFKRTYKYVWGAIHQIITQLEEFLQSFEVKLAIINGPRLYELAKINLPILTKEEIYSMISNIDQIEVLLDHHDTQSKSQVIRSIIKVQCILRGYIARIKFKKLKIQIQSIIIIQSIARMHVYRAKTLLLLNNKLIQNDEKFMNNQRNLENWWKSKSNEDISTVTDRSRLVICIPSLSIAEYLRMDCENIQTIQNMHISNLYLLQDPSIHVLFITAFSMTNNDKTYHEKFLSVLGISILPKRLHFITPEMINNLPPHLSLASALWYSTSALNKIKTFIKRFPKTSVLLPTISGWVEKRIAIYLNISLFSSEPIISETISSRSFMKSIFMEASMSIPIGSHDIYSIDDLYIAFSRLIASNIGVCRWIIKLNYDWNNESYVVVDVNKFTLIAELRSEQNILVKDKGNVNMWYSKDMQLAIRKRIIYMLKKELHIKASICRKDIYSNWDYYIRLLKQYGGIIEAEPIEKLGFIDGVCFIDPIGNVHGCKGLEVHVNDNYQVTNYIYPQTLTPKNAIEGAMVAVANNIYAKYKVIGYVTIHFISFWDAQDNLPRLWAQGIQLGMRATFGALGIASIVSRNSPYDSRRIPLSLISESLPEDKERFIVYIPIVIYDPLRSTNDDSFFKLCRMRGIAFDIKSRIGTLFILIDSIVGGALSILCIGHTRKKSIELVIHTLSFIGREFGMDSVTEKHRYENLTSMLISFKKILKDQD